MIYSRIGPHLSVYFTLYPLPFTLYPLPFTFYLLPFTLYPLPFTSRQNTHSHDTVVHVKCITERTAQMFHSRNTRGSRLRSVVSLKQLIIPASCLLCCRTCHRTLLHDLSHQPHLSSDHILPHCPVLPRLILDWIKKFCEFHGGVADTQKSASPTGYEPKLTQSDDFEARRIELEKLDRNIGTDPYQIPERILGDDYQNPITEDTEETGKFGVDMPIKDTLRFRFS